MKCIVATRPVRRGAMLLLFILAQFAPALAQNQQRVMTPLTEAKDRQLWRKSIMRISPPEKGCFTVTYPSMVWQKTDCVIIPPHPVREPRQIQKKLVGD